MKTDEWLTLGLLGVGAYVLYKVIQGGSAVVNAAGNATAAAGNAVGGAVFDALNPNAAGESTYYTVTMPAGGTQAVPASAVNNAGQFTSSGTTYQIYVDPTVTSGVNKTAVPLPTDPGAGDDTSFFTSTDYTGLGS
jgi:hypothetical protein